MLTSVGFHLLTSKKKHKSDIHLITELVNESAFPSSNVSKFDVNDTGLDGLLEKNKAWAAKVLAEDPTFFSTIAEKQQPKILWIGKCA